MARSVSNVLKQAFYAPETGEAVFVLITLDHTDLAAPLRATSDGVSTVSRGATFTHFPFRLALPEDSEDRPPRMQLRVDNVDRQIVQAVRQVSSAPTVLVEVVLASDPDAVEASWPDYELLDANYDALEVSGDLGLEQFYRAPFPKDLYTPSTHPGMF